jgi:hypothetical protein
MAGNPVSTWTADDELRFVMRLGLQKGLKRVGGKRAFTEDQRNTIAAEILDHLRLANYRITSGQPARGHSALMPPSHPEEEEGSRQ